MDTRSNQRAVPGSEASPSVMTLHGTSTSLRTRTLYYLKKKVGELRCTLDQMLLLEIVTLPPKNYFRKPKLSISADVSAIWISSWQEHQGFYGKDEHEVNGKWKNPV